ncbi:MAG: hypothetical protein E7279_01600 [Lachnospiraceae bacterium]|nr:hypothetical protein [Lachnospiraceae bacterium]
MEKKTKIIIAIIAAIVVVGGAVGTVLGVNAYNNKKEREAVEAFLQEMDKARTNAINAYNERVNQIVAPLGDVNTNSDVNAMTNAVNELNNVINDVNNDTLLMQEQKDAVNGNVTNQINVINARIGAVNEENARVEAEANAKAEAQRQAQAQASSNKKKNSGGSSSSSASSSNSGGATGSGSSAGAGESAAPAQTQSIEEKIKNRTASQEEVDAYLKERYGDVYVHSTGEKL